MEFQVFGVQPYLEVPSEHSSTYVRLFPNPALETVCLETEYISGRELEIQVLNVQGQMVLNKFFKNEMGPLPMTSVINLSGLSTGIYFIKIIQGNNIITEKLILK